MDKRNEPMSLSYKIIQSPVGKLKLVASDKGLVAILWENDNSRRVLLKDLPDRPRLDRRQEAPRRSDFVK